jgi:hypothetical protein
MQTLEQCTLILSQSHKDDESMMEMSGRALAKLTRLHVNANGQESELDPAMGLK